MSYTNPQYHDFVAFFAYDWPYGTDPNQSVTQPQVNAAFMRTNNYNLNPCLFGSQSEWNQGYLFLTAHYLVLMIRASGQGLNGQASWVQASKSVGGVSEGFSIPQRILDNPVFAMFTKTNYGMQFLEMMLPRLGGSVGIARGHTKP
jgi:hypothetical protein